MSVELLDKTSDVNPAEALFVAPAEETLLIHARAGDPAAFEILVLPHRERILRLARRILRNPEDAEDVVQIAFLEALRHLDGFEGRSKFSSWLMTIATNAALMRLRGKRNKYEMSLDQLVDGADAPARLNVLEPRPNPEQDCSVKELQAVLAAAVNQLGPRYRRVFHLRHIQELSTKETARALGISVTTVKARLHRARIKLTRTAQSMLAPKRRQSIVRSQRRAVRIAEATT
jgi:RNA polymerase sigma-70 factor, ECF subfamily